MLWWSISLHMCNFACHQVNIRLDRLGFPEVCKLQYNYGMAKMRFRETENILRFDVCMKEAIRPLRMIIKQGMSSQHCVGDRKAFADKPPVRVPMGNSSWRRIFWLIDAVWDVCFPKILQAAFGGERENEVESLAVAERREEADDPLVFRRVEDGVNFVVDSVL